MKKVAVFCSNSVNGGTAKMFAEMLRGVQKYSALEPIKWIPCVNKNNKVKIYDTMEELVRLDIQSEVEILGEVKPDVNVIWKIIRRIKRNIQYHSQIKKNLRVMKDFLKKEKFDAVVIHNGGYVGDGLCNQFLKAAFLEGIQRRIMVFHNDFEKTYAQKLRFLPYDRMINKCATDIAVPSEYTRDRIKRDSFIKKEIQVIYNGISAEPYLKKQELSGYDETYCNIGMIGNFFPYKGHLYLIEAIAKLKGRTQSRFRLNIIGNVYDDAYYTKCTNYIQKNGLSDSIKIYRGIYNAGEYVGLFRFLVVPSVQDESFGLIALEAMSQGRPVIAFACGGLPEVVQQEKDGLIVPVGNADALAEAIQRLLENASLCDRLGKQAREDYEQMFTEKAMGLRYLRLLNLQVM